MGETGKTWDLLDAVSGTNKGTESGCREKPQSAGLATLPGSATQTPQSSQFTIKKGQREQEPVWTLGADLG